MKHRRIPETNLTKAPESGVVLDRADQLLLQYLVEDARSTHVQLADRVHLSPTACARRLRQLEQSGVIQGYAARVNTRALGLRVTVIVHIALATQNEGALARFEASVTRCSAVVSCHLMTGRDDYLLIVRARDVEDYERIHKESLARLPGVARIESSFAIRTIVDRSFPSAPVVGVRD